MHLKKTDYNTPYFFLRLWSKIVMYGSGIRFNRNNFDISNLKAPYVIIANHTSVMDIMLMFILNKQPMAFVGKAELLKLPIFGYIFKKLHIMVNRDDAKSRMKVFRACSHKLQKGICVCIFPEGGVPEEETFLDNFLDGPFAIALMNKVPLVTSTICGMKEILPFAYFRGKPGTANVYLNEITQTENLNKKDIQLLKEKSYQLINKQLKKCYAP